MINNGLIQILIDNKNSWMWEYIEHLELRISQLGFDYKTIDNPNDVIKGEILILLSCEKRFDRLNLNKHNLVIHESELPKGRGWSPLTWQILEGKNKIPICLFEAEQNIDNGKVYYRDLIEMLSGVPALLPIGRNSQQNIDNFQNQCWNLYSAIKSHTTPHIVPAKKYAKLFKYFIEMRQRQTQ